MIVATIRHIWPHALTHLRGALLLIEILEDEAIFRIALFLESLNSCLKNINPVVLGLKSLCEVAASSGNFGEIFFELADSGAVLVGEIIHRLLEVRELLSVLITEHLFVPTVLPQGVCTPPQCYITK